MRKTGSERGGAAPSGRTTECDYYSEQLDAIVFTDCTRTRCPALDVGEALAEGAPDVPVAELPVPDELLLLASVPVISTFSPTCLDSSLSCPSRMYLLPLDALALALPAVPLVLVPLLVLEREEEPLPNWAFARTYCPLDAELPVAAPLVDDPVPDVPVVPL